MENSKPMAALVGLATAAIDEAAIRRHLACAEAGGEVLFSGTVRDHNQGRKVTALTFEAFEEMAIGQLNAIGRDLLARWDVSRVALVHRVGRVELGAVCVVVGVSAPHRAAAFEACRYGLDTLKKDVAIWKRETFEGGEEWVTNHA
jgi:molybdopterin synthase catalytic subunit